MAVYKGLTYNENYTICYGFDKNTDTKLIKTLKFHPKTKVIDNDAFKNQKDFDSIIFPRKLAVIKERAFENCGNIKNIKFNKNIIHIGNYAFDDTYCHFEKFYFPKHVKVANFYAFSGFSVDTLILPDNFNRFEPSSFFNVKKYVIKNPCTYETINGNLYLNTERFGGKVLIKKAFSDTPVEKDCSAIAYRAFEDFKNENFELHLENLDYVEELAFLNTNLGKVYTKGVLVHRSRDYLNIKDEEEINPFRNCKIKKLFLYKDTNFFYSAKNLIIEDIEVEEGCKYFYIKDGALYKNNVLLYYLNSNKKEKFVCPEKLELIESFAFPGNFSLKEIILNNNNVILGENSINQLPNLEKLLAPSRFNSIGKMFHNTAPIKELFIPDGTRISLFGFEEREKELTIYMTRQQMDFLKEHHEKLRGNEKIKIEFFKTYEELFDEGKTITEINKILKKQENLLNSQN